MKICWLIAIILLTAGCATDPGAVVSFSALAPDANKLHSLTVAYADAPRELVDLDVLKDVNKIERDQLANDVETRNIQVAQIDALHAVLVEYMKSLGALANNSLVQTSTDTKFVTDGLTALSKAKPSIGLTNDMITGVGSICTFLGDAATAAYRQKELSSIIEKSEAPFQQLVAVEKIIVKEVVIKELNNVKNRTRALAVVTHALNLNAEEESRKYPVPNEGDTGVKGLDPRLRGSGAADIASLYLLKKEIFSDLATLDLQIKAATDYVAALDKISSAHTVLYNNRKNVLTVKGAKNAIIQLSPLVKEANIALHALKNM